VRPHQERNLQQFTEQPDAPAMTFTLTLQADYTRGKSICAKRLAMGFDSMTPEMVTRTDMRAVLTTQQQSIFDSNVTKLSTK
jgi:hypothetical protein